LCPQASGNNFYVDPASGSDSVGTGNNGSAGCAFKTISRALAVIGANPNAGTKVYVLATAQVSASSNGESFPIDVPTNLTIMGSGGRPQILLPANTTGFLMHHVASGLNNLSIDGNNHMASYGVYVSTGASLTTTITSLQIQNMSHDGIAVVGTGQLTVQSGVQSTSNGTNSNTGDGLRITDQAHVVLNVTSGDAVHFDQNTAHGIRVQSAGSIALTAAPSTGGAGTVTTNHNAAAGLWIEQTPGSSPPANVVTGLVSWANTTNGIRIVAGSSATLRQSYVLANGSNGIIVSTSVNGSTRSNDVTQIDLGTTAGPSYGGNVVQAALGNNPNAGAGICLALDRMAGSQLNAAGNMFAGPTDCATSSATLHTATSCSGAVDYAVQSSGSTTNTVVVSPCH